MDRSYDNNKYSKCSRDDCDRDLRREDLANSSERDIKREKSCDRASSRERDSRREKSYVDREWRRERGRSREREGTRHREVKREELDDHDVAGEGRKKIKEREENEESGEKMVMIFCYKREKKRRFEDNFVKEEDDEGVSGNVNVSGINVNKEVNDGGSANGNGAAIESFTMSSRTVPETSMATGHPLPTKVGHLQLLGKVEVYH